MNHETQQFVTRKEFKPVERKSSLYMKIENFDKFEWNETIESKKVHFLEGDDVWWISVQKSNDSIFTFLRITFFLQASHNIWKSGIWSCSFSGTCNRFKINFNSGSHIKVTKKLSEIIGNDNYISGESKCCELNVTMSLSPTETSSDKLPVDKFISPTVQYKKILANNKEILNDPKYSDFTFVVQGKKYKVHKCILAAASPIFDKLFTTNFRETVTNECNVTDIEPTIFQHLLNFIYCGELPEKFNEVAQALYEAAHYYQITELADMCISVTGYHLSKDNALDVYKWADTYNVENLKKDAWNIIQFEILETFEDTPPPPFQAVQLLIEYKIKKENALEQYRQTVRDVENARENVFK